MSITQHILISNLQKLESWQHVSATKIHHQAKIEQSLGTFNDCAIYGIPCRLHYNYSVGHM